MEKVNGETETCKTRHEVTTAQIITETREIEKIEGRLHDEDGVKDEHTHTEVARLNGGELPECVETRCKQLDSLLQERGEGICPLEAVHDQVGPVELCEVEGTSAVDECTRSLGWYRDPGTPCGNANPQRDCPGVCG